MDPAQTHYQPRPQTLARARPETSVRVRPEVHAQTQTEAGCPAGGGSEDPCAPVRGAGFRQENTRVVCNGEALVGATIAGSRLAGSTPGFGGGSGGAVVAVALRSSSTGSIETTKSGEQEHTGCRAVTDPHAKSDDNGGEEDDLREGSKPEEWPAGGVAVDVGVYEARECSESTLRPEDAAVSSHSIVGLGETSDKREIAVFNSEEQHRRKQSLRRTSEEVSDIHGIVEACLNVEVLTPAQDLRRAVAVDPQNLCRRNEVEERFTASMLEAAEAEGRRSSSPPQLGGHDSSRLPIASSCVLRGDPLTENNVEAAHHKTVEENPRAGGAGDNRDEERTTMTALADTKAVDVAHQEVKVRLRARPGR